MKKLLLYSLFLFNISLSAQIQVASDINEGNFGSSIENVFEFKNNLFFSAEINDQFSNTSERKLWRTDGTESGTEQVGNLPPEHYFPSDNIIYYTNVNDEIWKTDGTEANTSKIHDGKSYFDPLGSFKDHFYYMEITEDATGIGLFKTNGTETILLKTFAGEENTRSAIYNDDNAVFKFSDEKCVLLLESKNTGVSAYISDGTANGTTLFHDSSKGTLAKRALEFHTLNNNLTIYTDKDKRVWVTDGSLDGTKLIKTLSGSNSRKIHSMTVFNNKVYFGFLFTADFWETNGTEEGTKELFSNINNDGNVQGIVKRENDLVIFTQKGIHLFDGTSTTKVNTPDITNINYFSFKKIGDKVYFTANYKNQGDRVWITNGLDTGTYSLAPFWPDNSVPTYQMHSVNGKFVFTTGTQSGNYNTGELWVSDGTNQGTKLLKDINKTGNLDSEPKFQTELNGKIYFAADDNIHGRELFVFDGTTTTLLKDIYPGFNSSNPYDFYVLNNKIIFKAYTLEKGLEFWITDGTEAGTVLLKDINPNGDGFLNDNRAYVRINQFKIFNNELYFFADNGTNGMEIWKTNGTEAGTMMLKDINPGFNASYRPALDQRPRIVEHNNELYFYVSSSGSSNNLSYFQMWKTDGTTTGTQKISIIENTIKEGTLLPNTYFSFNNNFYFYGVDKATNKKELYRTDFNTVTKIEGTGNHTAFYPVKDKIYYTNNDFISGKGEEIWAIEKDDSFAIVDDIVPGTQGSNAGNFYVFNDYLYFSIRNQNYQPELWRLSNNTAPEKIFTKDTETATSSIEQYFDFIPKNDILFINTKHNGNADFIYRMYGIKNSSTNLTPVLSIDSYEVPYENLPNGINSLSAFLDNKVYFTGNISEEGEELLEADFGAVLSIDSFDLLNSNKLAFSIFPNPVHKLLNIKSNSTIKSGIIYNLLGKKVVTINSNSTDVSKLKAGIYILKIEDEFGNISSKKWIKK